MIPYTKLNSQGNDFILVEHSSLSSQLTPDKIKHYSDREVIGCDQFFIVDTTTLDNVNCDVYNQDGSKASQCGNGLRATMLYLHKKYNINMTNLIVCNKSYPAEINDDLISIDMGSPQYIDNIINSAPEYSITKNGLVLTLNHNDTSLKFSFIPITIGNSHCVVFSDNCIDEKERISKIIDDIYDKTMNIGFIENASSFLNDCTTVVKLTVNERGAGYTKSCGSGATAAAICLFRLYELKSESKVKNSLIKIRQVGGELEIIKNYNPDSFKLIGPSSIDGEGNLE